MDVLNIREFLNPEDSSLIFEIVFVFYFFDLLRLLSYVLIVYKKVSARVVLLMALIRS